MVRHAGLAVMDATTGSLSWWDTPDWDIGEVALSSDGRVAAWNVRVDGFTQIRARDVVSGRNVDVPLGTARGWGAGLVLSPDGGQALLRLSTPTRPWNVAAVDMASGEVRWLTNAAPANADPASFVEPEPVRYPSSDGRQQIPGFLYRPSDSRTRAGVVSPSTAARPGTSDRATCTTVSINTC
jgi:dipeptidyl aminopeptidase/acylaminoacyl peptidase